jgi:hypothetical protein
VTTQHVVLKASALLKVFGQGQNLRGPLEGFLVLSQAQLIHLHVLPPVETYVEASEFMAPTQPLLHGPNRYKHWIINTDQNPLWFSYHRTKTLDNITRPHVLQRDEEGNGRTDFYGMWSLAPIDGHFHGTASGKDRKKRAAEV